MSDEGRSRPTGGDMPGTQGRGSHEVDVLEHGAEKDGAPQSMDRRLFMQLLVFEVPESLNETEVVTMLGKALEDRGSGGVIYADVANPRGLGLLTWSEDPAHFVETVRPTINRGDLRKLALRPDFTMLGRSYASGYERDLPYWILQRPIDTATNEDWPWAVWYPLRRSGAFAKLPAKEQAGILREHAVIGRAYGQRDLAHDIRLACHGIDAADNEFVIGLVGKDLHPLSHVVQTMRKTRQTSEYIVKMGPFFIGHALWQSAGS